MKSARKPPTPRLTVSTRPDRTMSRPQRTNDTKLSEPTPQAHNVANNTSTSTNEEHRALSASPHVSIHSNKKNHKRTRHNLSKTCPQTAGWADVFPSGWAGWAAVHNNLITLSHTCVYSYCSEVTSAALGTPGLRKMKERFRSSAGALICWTLQLRLYIF